MSKLYLYNYHCSVTLSWRKADQPAKIYLHIMLIAMLSQVCVIIETAE